MFSDNTSTTQRKAIKLHHLDAIIDDRLYIGDLTAATSKDILDAHGITHILSVCPDFPAELDKSGMTGNRRHMSISVEDSEYENILPYFPTACDFIESAIGIGVQNTNELVDEKICDKDQNKNRILVHCFMGVSRSVTIVSAYLIRSRQVDALDAIKLVKQHRPQVCPNYGFVRQLQVFAACNSFLSATGQPQPPSTYPAYVSWLRRQPSDVRRYLSKLEDTTPTFNKKLYINSEFPTDPVEASVLLSELGITHVLSLSPSKLSKDVLYANGAVHHDIALRSSTTGSAELVLALPTAVDFIEEALDYADEQSAYSLTDGGDEEDDSDVLSPAVLVHSQMESRATAVVCAYLMKSQHIPASLAFSKYIENALPLFSPSESFLKQLEVYETSGYAPTPDKVVAAGLGPGAAQFRSTKLHSTIPCSTAHPARLQAGSMAPASKFSSLSTTSASSMFGTPLSLGGASTSATTPDTTGHSVPRSRNGDLHPSFSRRSSEHILPNTPATPNMALEMANMRLTADHLLRDTLSPLDMAAFGETLKNIQRERAKNAARNANGVEK